MPKKSAIPLGENVGDVVMSHNEKASSEKPGKNIRTISHKHTHQQLSTANVPSSALVPLSYQNSHNIPSSNLTIH